jgi:S1-C subfamily serine protease
MLIERDKAIHAVSCGVAKELFQRVAPELLDKFGIVETQARRPLDFTLGPLDESLEIAAQVLRSISHAIRTKGEAINEAPAFKDIEAIVLEGISTRMGELGREAEAGQILKGLEATFAEHPSLLDRVTGAVIPPFKTEDDQLFKMERDLQRCVLKVTAGCWQGTAFAIGVKGCILTANHVVRERNGDKVTLTFGGKTGEEVSGEATVIDSNLQNDIALLKIEDERTQDRFKQAGLEPCSPEMQDANRVQRERHSKLPHPVVL